MKMLQKLLLVLLSAALIFATAFGAEFTDGLGRQVSVQDPAKVAVASAGLAECWLLAGGEIYAATNDAFGERGLEIGEDAIDLGGLKEPSLEMILASKPDLLILSSTLSGHLAMAETLEKAKINYACFDTESFADYLLLLRIFTEITGREDLYEKHGLAQIPVIERAIEQGRAEGKKVLLLRSSSVRIKALNSESMVGSMLKEFGCENIADSDANILSDLSLEAIVKEEPDYIFITCMGDADEAVASLQAVYGANPLWQRLSAVKGSRCFYLEKELFHYKPNGRWGESYEKLAELLAQD